MKNEGKKDLEEFAYAGALRVVADDVVSLVKKQLVGRLTDNEKVKALLSTELGDGLVRLALASSLKFAPVESKHVDSLCEELFISSSAKGFELIQSVLLDLATGVNGLLKGLDDQP